MSEPRDTTPSASGPLLSIVVPVYNEARHLRLVIARMMHSPCPIRREWIFVDDTSTDGSRQILRELQENPGFRLIELSRKRGKGSAVIRGLHEASGDFIMFQDAGLEYDPFDVPDLLAPLLQDRADVVFGNRFSNSVRQVHRTWHFFWNQRLTTLSNACSGLRLADVGTHYKIFRADLLKAMQLKSRDFGIEIELTSYVAKTTARVYELPVHYHHRAGQGGKSWLDGIAALFHLMRFNFLISAEDAFLRLPEIYRTSHHSPGAYVMAPDDAKDKP